MRQAVRASRLRAYNSPPEDWGGYLQIDDGFKWDAASNTVTHINGQPIDLGKTYRISCLYLSLSGMNRNQPLIDFGNTIPGDSFTQLGDTGRGAKELIVDCCSRALLAQVHKMIAFLCERERVRARVRDIFQVRVHVYVREWVCVSTCPCTFQLKLCANSLQLDASKAECVYMSYVYCTLHHSLATSTTLTLMATASSHWMS
jgi:hypothetical protein